MPIPGNVIEGNTANGNLGDGISVSAGGHEVTANAAHNNAAFGITAGEFVIDGGDNTASGNGEPEQCVGVVCTPGTTPPVIEPDLTAPNTEILTAPADNTGTLDPHTFTFTGTDDVAPATALRFECRLDAPPDPPAEPPEPPEPGEPPEPVEPPDSETWHECGSPLTYNLLPSGEHTFEVRAIDPFDNVDLTPDSYTWTVIAAPPGPDSTPPSTTIVDAPSDPTSETTAVFTFRGSDNSTPGPSLTYQCSLDGSPFAACTSPATYPALDVGEHTFEVRGVDVQGNIDPTGATHTWTVVEPDPDTTGPDTTIDSGPDLTTVSTDASFAFSSGEDGVTFECSLDDADFEPCTSSADYTGLEVGAHTFAVRAVDAALNPDPTPATYQWFVSAPPVDAAVTCGQVITQSTRVTNDLLDCPADGLVIGAHGITLDLDNHTIDGTNLGFGVLNNGFDSVTIANGTVQEFDAGVQLGNGTALGIVDNMTVQLQEFAGIQLTNADDGTNGNIIRNNTVVTSGGGIWLLTGTQHAIIRGNTIAGVAGIGLHLFQVSSNFVEGNEHLRRRRRLGAARGGERQHGDRQRRERVRRLERHRPARLQRQPHRGQRPPRWRGRDLHPAVVRERADRQRHPRDGRRGHHPRRRPRQPRRRQRRPLQLRRDRDGRRHGQPVEANNASESGGVGIEVGDGSVSNVFVLNTANYNEAGGIPSRRSPHPVRATCSTATRRDTNTGDGINVGDVGHMIAGNSANNNQGWGIYAADTVVAGQNIDGGGNTASGNTGGEVDPITLLPVQCKNIVCDGGLAAGVRCRPPTRRSPRRPLSGLCRRRRRSGSPGWTTPARSPSSAAWTAPMEADFVPCTSPQVYTSLDVGSTPSRCARSISSAMWIPPRPPHLDHQRRPPGVPPETTIDGGPTPPRSARRHLHVLIQRAERHLRMLPRRPTFALCTSPQAYSGLAVGGHLFEVRAMDSELPRRVTRALRVERSPRSRLPGGQLR